MARDVYKQRLYRAERVAFKDQPRTPRDLAQLTERVTEITGTCGVWRAAVERWCPRLLDRPVDVALTTGRTSFARSGTWSIRIAQFQHSGQDWVLLHELSHLPVPGSFQAHGREFSALYLQLVNELYGYEQMKALRTAMRERGVPHERDQAYVRYLRRNLTAVSRNPGGYEDAHVVLTSGRVCYVGSHFSFAGDVLLTDTRTAGFNTPGSVMLDEIAYLSARRVVDR